ncbi:MAG: hypothetical protein CEE43_00100 [Promethearchaeota archaeon Loki_b32]|nr:MAG: hypothetical protein CEE43_00100 [Candidatus Lokiarchaeota archaeon Loki_b32]
MKKLFINKQGKVVLKEVREPLIETKGSLVRTKFALISSGTELSTIKEIRFRSLSLIKKIRTSKDYRKLLFSELKNRGIKEAIKFTKLLLFKRNDKKNFSSPSINLFPIGYSCSGIVQETNIDNLKVNDRVACGGSNHAEIIYSPKNLTCKIPKNVSFEEAAFATLGAIALHGIHRANIKLGENVGVIGTGLIGLLVVQLIKVIGGRVFALDLINKRLNLAKELGADFIFNPKYYNSERKVSKFTDGKGLDSIIICATSKSPKLLEDAVDLIRDKGNIIMLGGFPININRAKLYYKEVDLLISRSYGPGRYDNYYEYEGYDYPEKYVPWTEKRNMEFVLKLISEKKLNVKRLITDIIPVEKANTAYNKLEKDPINTIAILLKFFKDDGSIKIIKDQIKEKEISKKLIIGLIGCGSFAQGSHLPHLLSNPNCKIKGISTQHNSSANYCKENYHPEFVTTDYKKILKDPEIETVFIYTRHNTHKKFAIKALKAGKNVFVEKPMGITYDQCVNVYNTVKETKKLYSIGFNRRYSSLIQISKGLLKDRTNPIIINYRIANSFIPGHHWIFDPNEGGGPIIGEFCHFVDLVLYLINSSPIELIAKGGSLSHKNLDVFDSCTVIIKFKNASLANLVYTDLNAPDMPKERIEIFSGESSIIIDSFKTMQIGGFDAGNKFLSEPDKGHEKEMKTIVNSNLGLEKLLVNETDAIRAMDLCFKTIESIKKNKSINIESEFYE